MLETVGSRRCSRVSANIPRAYYAVGTPGGTSSGPIREVAIVRGSRWRTADSSWPDAREERDQTLLSVTASRRRTFVRPVDRPRIDPVDSETEPQSSGDCR
ncbi:hypothetical protein HYG81_11010 [Natrinema zhouii]|uniref:Uncharacterized protein n=1 Tax=Natrinema zhouii TaxID=1710539 RepID=A0A7D6CNM9_9EURY|nr:hypothetical protein [Natrinema zhouii]QLK24650.1 hypothetical protein HYG81_11010 [Natrinema zhouii]